MEEFLNKKAPDFELFDQNGKAHKLSQYIGRWVLIYFYPKDDTPGCTKEACAFRDDFLGFEKIKATILGISADSVASHKKFADKYKLPFTLLADTEKNVIKKYKVWGKKKFMGREYDGIIRASFLIDSKGKVAKVYPKVTPAEHSKEIIADINNFNK